MRILIFGEPFNPPAYLPRLRYFCSCFLEKGCTVDYVVEKAEGSKFIPNGVNVIEIPYYKRSKGVLYRLEWAIKLSLGLFYDHKGNFFYKKSRKLWSKNKYDLVFASTCFTFPLTTASKVAATLGIPFFADCRDIAEQTPNDFYLLSTTPRGFLAKKIAALHTKIQIERRNAALKCAKGVTTVSPFHVKTLSRYNNNVNLVYNGYDESKFTAEKTRTKKFTISYFGRVYSAEYRNPTLLFAALAKLRDEQLISLDDCLCRWFVEDGGRKIVADCAKPFALENVNEYHSFTTPDNLPKENCASSVIVVLTNDAASKQKYHGIMTTKFFEAAGCNRPLLCIPDNGDTLSDIIKQSNCGCVSSSVDEIAAYLQKKYAEWKQTGCTTGDFDEKTRSGLSRRAGAEILWKTFLAD